MERALRQQLLGAAKDNSVWVKHRPHQGYSGSSMLDLFTHLYKTYTVITNADWIVNNKLFHKAYAPTDPIKVVWFQINDAVTYADSGSTPYFTNQVVDHVYQIVFNAGMVTADCQEWNKRVAVDKTIPHLKVFFAASHR